MKNKFLISELRQHGLMAANKVRQENPDQKDAFEPAYERVKLFSKVQCPCCWVENGVNSELNVELYANNDDLYVCASCGFSEMLPKLEE